MQNLNSDDLRKQLQENNTAMNTLTEDNQKIVELLAQRGLKAIDSSSDLAETRALLDPERRADAPLTTDELEAGGWWCGDVSGECAAAFESKSINAYNSEAWGTARPGWAGCLFSGGNVARTMSIEGGKKQIHRIGNEFYWGAP